MEDELVKIIVIGDSLVGKTSFIHRYVNNSFRQEYKSTIGVDFSLKVVQWSDTKTIKLQLWDIAGQERFTFMTRAYYKDAKGCLLMFDLSNAQSFQQVIKWKSDLDSKVRSADGSVVPCLLVANKTDLPERAVTKEEMTSLCGNLKFTGWMETSVKEDLMVTETMECLLKQIQDKPQLPNGDLTESMYLTSESTSKYGDWMSKCKC